MTGHELPVKASAAQVWKAWAVKADALPRAWLRSQVCYILWERDWRGSAAKTRLKACTPNVRAAAADSTSRSNEA